MKTLPIFRTPRLTVQLRELTIGQSLAIAAMPSNREQAECTAFLRAAIETASIPDPSDWTVEERTFAICHYIGTTSEEGPNFSVGADGHYAEDYLGNPSDAVKERHPIGELCGDKWEIRPLTGRMAEIIERCEGEFLTPSGEPYPVRLHWIFGAMAAQLVREGEEWPTEGLSEADAESALLARMQIFANFGEGDFLKMLSAFYQGRAEIAHIFRYDFMDKGIVILPNEEGKGKNLLPARFPANSCLCEVTRGLV